MAYMSNQLSPSLAVLDAFESQVRILLIVSRRVTNNHAHSPGCETRWSQNSCRANFAFTSRIRPASRDDLRNRFQRLVKVGEGVWTRGAASFRKRETSCRGSYSRPQKSSAAGHMSGIAN
jgi:hypothetical protein